VAAGFFPLMIGSQHALYAKPLPHGQSCIPRPPLKQFQILQRPAAGRPAIQEKLFLDPFFQFGRDHELRLMIDPLDNQLVIFFFNHPATTEKRYQQRVTSIRQPRADAHFLPLPPNAGPPDNLNFLVHFHLCVNPLDKTSRLESRPTKLLQTTPRCNPDLDKSQFCDSPWLGNLLVFLSL